MNYRHAYHAGGFADVLKHALLAWMIERLKRKEKPFCVLDTHAGIGRYDLRAEPAQKTREFEHGIARLFDAPPDADLDPYLATVRRLNPDGRLRWYPGSPELARALLRRGDRLLLCELHPDDARTLRRACAHDARVRVERMDGYLALKALLPPHERRGLVLIDPSFEAPDEFARIVRGLRHALRRWATGTYAVWYPVKDRAPVSAFHAQAAALAAEALVVELLLRPDDDPETLNGCGLLVINPPWQLDGAARRVLPRLLARLGAEALGAWRVEMLARADRPEAEAAATAPGRPRRVPG